MLDRTRFVARWFFCCLALAIVGCGEREEQVDYQGILSRVLVGDPRDQAVQALSDAWFHAECPALDSVQDIFLYGPKQHERVTIITVWSVMSGGRLVVQNTGTMDAQDADIRDFDGSCRPLLRDAFEMEE